MMDQNAVTTGDFSSLQGSLESLWPPLYDRSIPVPFPYQMEKVSVWAGDFGIFRVRPGLPPLFVTLGHIRDDLPGAFTMIPARGYSECGDRIYR